MLTDFCSSPTKEHWIAVKRILRYLKGTPNYGLTYSSNVDTDGPLIGYSDANWAGVVNDCKSTSGYFFIMSGAAVSWKSQKKTNVCSGHHYRATVLSLCSREGSGHHYRATVLSNEGHDSRHTDKRTNV